ALSLEQRARLRIAITGAMEAARKVVDFAYRAAGTTAIFEGSAFERRFRDLHALLAQGQAHLSNFESAGQALFGIEPAQIIALQRLAAHEPRLGGPRHHAFAHDRAAQRADAIRQKQAGGARALERQEI